MNASQNNSTDQSWIVNFGVHLIARPNQNYFDWSQKQPLDFEKLQATELILIIDSSYFQLLPTLPKNCTIILVASGDELPPKELFQKAKYICKSSSDPLFLELLKPYLLQSSGQERIRPNTLHIICDDLGEILFADQDISDFFQLKEKNFYHLKEIGQRFRLGELMVFEPMEELLKFDSVSTWLSFRHTQKTTVNRIFFEKNKLPSAHGYVNLLSFHLWPEKSQLEESLKANINAYARLMEESFDAILISDASRIIKYASPGIKRLAGYDPEYLIGLDTADFTLPEDAKQTHPLIAEVREAKRDRVHVEHRIRHADGSYIWIDALISDHRNTPGINGIVSSIRDIDAEKRNRLALEQSKLRFELASRATKDVIWDLDVQSGKIIWGENLTSIFGWRAEELDSIEKWMDKIPSADQEEVNNSFDALFNNNEDYWLSFYNFQCKDGSLASIEDRGYAWRNDEGKVFRLIGAMHDNTYTQKFANQLSQGEERFRRLFEESLIGVSLFSYDNLTWLDCNQALLNILGFRREELLKMSLFDLIPRDKKTGTQASLESLKASESAMSFQADLIRKDQSIIKVALSAFSSVEMNDERRIWMHILDLSPIIESNVALKEAENRFRSYIEKSSDIFVTLNTESIYEYVSPNIKNLLGYNPQEVIGLHNFDLIHPDDHAAVIKAYSEADGEFGKVTRSIFRGLHKDGSTRWVEANGKIEQTEQGPKAFINIRDIEKEHHNEEELRKLSLVADKTENAVLISDENFSIIWTNRSFENLSGLNRSDALNQNALDFLVRKKDLEKLKLELQQSDKVSKFVCKSNVKRSKKLWLELSLTPAYTEKNELINYIIIAVDITEKLERDKEIRKNLKLIKAQNERLKSFAHISSHSFLANCKAIKEITSDLKKANYGLVKSELLKILVNQADNLNQSLIEIQSVLNIGQDFKYPGVPLLLEEYISKAKRLLSRELISKLASIRYEGESNFQVWFFAPFLENALYTIFQFLIENIELDQEEIMVYSGYVDQRPFIRISAALELEKKLKNTDKQNKLFNFRESLELIKGQLQLFNGDLLLKTQKDLKETTIELYFKEA